MRLFLSVLLCLFLILPLTAIADEGQVVVLKEQCVRGSDGYSLCTVTIKNIGKQDVKDVKVNYIMKTDGGVVPLQNVNIRYLPAGDKLEITDSLGFLHNFIEPIFGSPRTIKITYTSTTTSH